MRGKEAKWQEEGTRAYPKGCCRCSGGGCNLVLGWWKTFYWLTGDEKYFKIWNHSWPSQPLIQLSSEGMWDGDTLAPLISQSRSWSLEWLKWILMKSRCRSSWNWCLGIHFSWEFAWLIHVRHPSWIESYCTSSCRPRQRRNYRSMESCSAQTLPCVASSNSRNFSGASFARLSKKGHVTC